MAGHEGRCQFRYDAFLFSFLSLWFFRLGKGKVDTYDYLPGQLATAIFPLLAGLVLSFPDGTAFGEGTGVGGWETQNGVETLQGCDGEAEPDEGRHRVGDQGGEGEVEEGEDEGGMDMLVEARGLGGQQGDGLGGGGEFAGGRGRLRRGGCGGSGRGGGCGGAGHYSEGWKCRIEERGRDGMNMRTDLENADWRLTGFGIRCVSLCRNVVIANVD